MSDELIKRLRGWRGYHQANLILDAADCIEALTAERDGLREALTDNHVALCRAEKAEAERDRLREALTELLQVFDGVPMLGIEASRRGEAARAALKGETP